MESAIIQLLVCALFGVVVGGGVYLTLFTIEFRDERAARLAALAAEAEAGTIESEPKTARSK